MEIFDWKQELTEDELMIRLHRVGGDVICEHCEKPYWRHPPEPRILGFDDRPFLYQLCDGVLGKL